MSSLSGGDKCESRERESVHPPEPIASQHGLNLLGADLCLQGSTAVYPELLEFNLGSEAGVRQAEKVFEDFLQDASLPVGGKGSLPSFS